MERKLCMLYNVMLMLFPPNRYRGKNNSFLVSMQRYFRKVVKRKTLNRDVEKCPILQNVMNRI